MRAFHLFIIAILSISCLSLAEENASKSSDWETEITSWRKQHEDDLKKPDGWFALVGLEWLVPGDNSVGSAPDNRIHLPKSGPAHLGILHLEVGAVTISPPPDGYPAGLTIAGQSPTTRNLPTGVDSDKDNPRLRIGSLEMYVIVRADRYALRIKDSQSEGLRQ